MDAAFDATAWQPTNAPEPGDEDVSAEVPALITTLNAQTREIYRHPYDANCWFRRAETLARMQYPELVVGDTYKATLLCRTLLARLCEDRRYRLGYGMGFWMLDETVSEQEDGDVAEEAEEQGRRDALEQRLVDLQDDARRLEIDNLYHHPTYEEGRFLQRPYPWMQASHARRDDKLVARINKEFALQPPKMDWDIHQNTLDAPDIEASSPCCILKRHAFGEFSVGDKDSSELLGVFAGRDMVEGTTIIIDETQTWGCTGPGTDGSTANLHGGYGCGDPIHPNLPTEDFSQDLRWIRERAGKYAAEVILRCRFLITCIRDQVAHPLDHTLIARLTPTYRRERAHLFSLDHDIAIPNDCLQQSGIDIFADKQYDTWVFFTLQARIENNSWSDPIHTCISPLFSLFNHSCEPNVEWSIKSDFTTMAIRVARDVIKGEQLFVEYDGFIKDQPLATRRKRYRKWFDADCQCTKCLREEEEQKVAGERCSCGCGGCKAEVDVVAEWDMVEKPVFPEDSWRRRRQYS